MQYKGGKKGMDCSLQVGDMGIGFPKAGRYSKNGVSWSPEVYLNHLFLNGNHDDPSLCKKHPNYIGDWGFIKEPSIFYVSGGYSIDHTYRTKDETWWKDEEIKKEEMPFILNSYIENKPKIVVSHECPLIIKKTVVTNEWKLETDSRTERLFQNMFDIHRPDYWIFGHHHKFLEKDIDGTHFVCLGELMFCKITDCTYEIPNLTWEGYK